MNQFFYKFYLKNQKCVYTLVTSYRSSSVKQGTNFAIDNY